MRRTEKKSYEKNTKRVEWSKATTTELVSDVFETFFTEQLDRNTDNGDKVLALLILHFNLKHSDKSCADK